MPIIDFRGVIALTLVVLVVVIVHEPARTTMRDSSIMTLAIMAAVTYAALDPNYAEWLNRKFDHLFNRQPAGVVAMAPLANRQINRRNEVDQIVAELRANNHYGPIGSINPPVDIMARVAIDVTMKRRLDGAANTASDVADEMIGLYPQFVRAKYLTMFIKDFRKEYGY